MNIQLKNATLAPRQEGVLLVEARIDGVIYLLKYTMFGLKEYIPTMQVIDMLNMIYMDPAKASEALILLNKLVNESAFDN